MKKLSSALLALTLTLSLAACSVSSIAPAPQAATPQTDPSRAYALEKLNEVNDMILERSIVPEDYLRYLPEDLAEAVKGYNEETALFHIFYTSVATDITTGLFYEHQKNPGDYTHSDLYDEWVGRISHYALYKNVTELCNNDPYLSYTLAKEAGGSAGTWPYYIETGMYDRDTSFSRNGYLTLVDSLLTQFDQARAALSPID